MVKSLTQSQEYSPRVARRRDAARAEILDAARALLFDSGSHALTIEAVARRAGISKPSVYYYFRDKEQLLETIILATLEADVAACLTAVRATTSGADAAVACLRATVTFYADDPHAARVMFGYLQAIGVREETTERHANPRINELFDAIAERIEHDQRTGRIGKVVHARRMAMLARMLGTGVAWTFALLPRAGTRSRHRARDLVDDAERTLRAGLRAR